MVKKNLDSLISNYSEIKDTKNLSISVNGNFPENTWIGTTYSSWKSETNLQSIYYPFSSSQITISSIMNLKNQLTNNFLKKIFEASGVTTTNKTYLLTDGKALGLDGDLLHIHVTESSSSSTSVIYNLKIPVLDINLDLSELQVTVSGDEIETATGKVEFDYNVGIDG